MAVCKLYNSISIVHNRKSRKKYFLRFHTIFFPTAAAALDIELSDLFEHSQFSEEKIKSIKQDSSKYITVG